jgi:hypothetical protein
MLLKTGDFTDPCDEIFRILISSVPGIPVEQGVHLIFPVLRTCCQVNDNSF